MGRTSLIQSLISSLTTKAEASAAAKAKSYDEIVKAAWEDPESIKRGDLEKNLAAVDRTPADFRDDLAAMELLNSKALEAASLCNCEREENEQNAYQFATHSYYGQVFLTLNVFIQSAMRRIEDLRLNFNLQKKERAQVLAKEIVDPQYDRARGLLGDISHADVRALAKAASEANNSICAAHVRLTRAFFILEFDRKVLERLEKVNSQVTSELKTYIEAQIAAGEKAHDAERSLIEKLKQKKSAADAALEKAIEARK